MHGENGDVACDGYHKYKVNALHLNLFIYFPILSNALHVELWFFEENYKG